MGTIDCSKCGKRKETKDFRILGAAQDGSFNFSDVCAECEDPLDFDTHTMERQDLIAEVKKLRAGIRQHRDAEGHNLCWYVPELWGLLPERLDPRPRVPPVGEFLENCAAYRASLDGALVQPIRWVPGKGLCFIETGP